MESELFTLIDFLGTAAFSISGVFAAMKKKLDIFGTFTIAFITGAGTFGAIIGDLPPDHGERTLYDVEATAIAAVA